MRWYEGGIADAVTVTRQKNAIFVVFIQGNIVAKCAHATTLKRIPAGTDDRSRQFSELFDNGNVSTQLESDLFVAIRIEANSVPHQQFVQICILFLVKTQWYGAPAGKDAWKMVLWAF